MLSLIAARYNDVGNEDRERAVTSNCSGRQLSQSDRVGVEGLIPGVFMCCIFIE
jgi:hypothetical protein